VSSRKLANTTVGKDLGEWTRQVGGQLQDREALRGEQLSDCLRTARGVADVVRASEGAEVDAVLCDDTPTDSATEEWHATGKRRQPGACHAGGCSGVAPSRSREAALTTSLTLFVPPAPFWTMLKLKTNCSEAHCGARHSDSKSINYIN